jgi:hypothetical protein
MPRLVEAISAGSPVEATPPFGRDVVVARPAQEHTFARKGIAPWSAQHPCLSAQSVMAPATHNRATAMHDQLVRAGVPDNGVPVAGPKHIHVLDIRAHQIPFPRGTVIAPAIQRHSHGRVPSSYLVGDVVVAGIAAEVITGAVCDPVTVGASHQIIVATAPANHVSTVTAAKLVVAAASEEPVVAGAARERLG